jgi:rubrerythrin
MMLKEIMNKKMKYTTQFFIEKAQLIHNNKYDYSKTEYINDKTKVCIICPIHGEFWMLPSNHIHKTHPQNCPLCSHPSKRKTTEDFIVESKQVHGNKYDYSKVEYINNKTKVCIICPIHGEFWQIPSDHLRGSGCKFCNIKLPTKKKPLMTTNEFINKAKAIHCDKYDYTDTIYKGSKIKVKIICPIHGAFTQKPNNHLMGQGCPLCGRNETTQKIKLTQKEIIKRFTKTHGEKYDYSQVKYVDRDEKVVIICPIHGSFKQTPHNHYSGQGCPKCAIEQRMLKQTNTKEIFIEKAQAVHGNKYDYFQVEYVNNKTKVSINCPKHGMFMQKPIDHIRGRGCPKCKQSRLEEKIELFLIKNKIEYVTEYHAKWLDSLTLDFYLPQHNIAIECQGIQHFQPIKQFGGEESFQKTLERDKKKQFLCETNNVQLLYFGDKKHNENIITSQKDLLNLIQQNYDTRF